MGNKSWRFSERERKYVQEVLDSGLGSSTEGSMCQRFEKAFSEKVGSDFAITFNSGTSTLHAALAAVGVQAGDEVITTPLTVISNVAVIIAQNAIPVFADVDPETFNIDPVEIEKKITKKTKAIMPVSLYGLPCDFDAIMKISKKYNIPIIHDAAQAHMAEYNDIPIAEIAHITSYSLENTKHITTGDGGIVVTDDEEYAVEMRKFSSLGYECMKSGDGRIRINKIVFQDPNYSRHDVISYNYRMPEIAAALGLGQLERIDKFIELRIKIAEMYLEVIKDCSYLKPQKIPSNCKSSYWTFAVLFENENVSWYEFRDKYVEFGGDGIYAAWLLSYEEDAIKNEEYKKRCPWVYSDLKYDSNLCPTADIIQKKLMQFVNNYGSLEEAKPKVEALKRTIDYFKDSKIKFSEGEK